MKNISDKDLQAAIIDLINGKITRKRLAKELETDLRTLHKRIMGVSETNPELYKEYIEAFPYQPKVRQDIDYEALIIDIISNMKSLQDASNDYGISIRTISRRMREIENSNPELIALYREHANYIKTRKPISEGSRIKIEKLERRPIILSSITENRESELRETISKFEELLTQEVSKAEAARMLGYADYPTIWKKYQELERIETEKKTKQKTSKSNTFKQSLKVNTESVQIIEVQARKKEEIGDSEIQIHEHE